MDEDVDQDVEKGGLSHHCLQAGGQKRQQALLANVRIDYKKQG